MTVVVVIGGGFGIVVVVQLFVGVDRRRGHFFIEMCLC